MIPVQFDYIAPERLADAVQLLKVRAGASALAGGHNLLLDLKRRRVAPTLLVDLRKIPELRDIRRAEDGGLDIGAMMTYSELLASEEVRKDYPALVEALASLGDAQVRNRATIGGSLAYNDPTADLPAVALVLEAVIKTVGPNGERARPAEEFLSGAFKTTLEPGEIVAAVHIPAPVAGAGAPTRNSSARRRAPQSAVWPRWWHEVMARACAVWLSPAPRATRRGCTKWRRH